MAVERMAYRRDESLVEAFDALGVGSLGEWAGYWCFDRLAPFDDLSGMDCSQEWLMIHEVGFLIPLVAVVRLEVYPLRGEPQKSEGARSVCWTEAWASSFCFGL